MSATKNGATAAAATPDLAAVTATPFDQLGKDTVVLSTGAVVLVGRLTLNQVLTVGRVGTRTLVSVTAEQIADVNNGNWAALLTLVPDETIEALLGVLLGDPGDHPWLETLDLADLGALAGALAAHNDVGPLVKVFSGAVSQRSSPNSPPSSDPAV